METQNIETRSIKDTLSNAGCYLGNIAELTEELDEVLVEDGDGKIVLDFDGWVQLVQVLWDKVKETVFECADGKELQVKLPVGLVGGLITAALGLIGFKL